jgi:hypothetical protein
VLTSASRPCASRDSAAVRVPAATIASLRKAAAADEAPLPRPFSR